MNEAKPYNHPDPFPEITNAQRHYWGWLDWWAYRRVRKLGVPSPWGAYGKGFDRCLDELNFVRNEHTTVSFDRERRTQ